MLSSDNIKIKSLFSVNHIVLDTKYLNKDLYDINNFYIDYAHFVYFCDSYNNKNIFIIIDNESVKNSSYDFTEVYSYLYFLVNKLLTDGFNIVLQVDAISHIEILKDLRCSLFIHFDNKKDFVSWLTTCTTHLDIGANTDVLSESDFGYLDFNVDNSILTTIISARDKGVNNLFIIDEAQCSRKCINYIGNGFLINQGETLASRLSS